MHNLPSELYHSQVVGKMSYIVSLLEQINSQSLCEIIRDDFKEEVHWIKEVRDFETIMNASASGQCPDFDTLSKKSLVLQELNRLITLIQPFALKQELIESMYKEMKNHNNLWSSFYLTRLNELEELTSTVGNMSLAAQYVFEAAVAKLKLHLSANGLNQKDSESSKLYQFAFTMRDIGYRGFEAQLPLFRTFINSQSSDYSFDDALTTDQQQLMIEAILKKSHLTITSKTLQNKLVDLKARGIVDKHLFSVIKLITKEEGQLEALTHVELNGQKLNAIEVETLFAKTSLHSTETAIQHTTLLCDLALIGKALPAVGGIINGVINSFTDANKAETLNPELLHQLVSSVVISKVDTKNQLEANALNQALNQLKVQLNRPDAINSNMDVNQLYQFINHQTETVLSAITPRKQKLDALGFGVPTFKSIEAVLSTLNPEDNSGINEIALEFYTAIQKAKETYFNDEKNLTTVKQLESISPNDFNEFFKECCDAGKKAAEKLNGSHSVLTIITDVLRAIANWGVYLMSFCSTPQFFKASRTAVDDLRGAVSSLKATLNSTLDHLELNNEVNVSLVANS